MYRIILENRAEKEIQALPNQVIQAVYDSIKELRNNPRPNGVKKLMGQDGWRVRVQDYRILYTINDKSRLVTIYRVKHRKDAYR